MTPAAAPAGTAADRRTAEALQATLAELIELAAQGKQAHWTVVGPQFRSVHLHLDEIVDALRTAFDDVAERLAAVGVAPDGRLETVVETAALEPLPAGWERDAEVVDRFAARMDTLGDRLRGRIDVLGELDPVSQDLLIGIAGGLEKQAWMLRAQRA